MFITGDTAIQDQPEHAKIRIVLFVHCFFPDHFHGTETYTLNLAKNLRTLGYEPIIVSAVFPGEPTKGQEISYYEYDTLPVYCVDKNYYSHTRLKDTYYQEALRSVYERLLLRLEPDIAHVTHLTNHTGVLLEIISNLGIPAVATMTDFYGHCLTSRLQRPDGALCLGPDSKHENCIVCYLAALYESLQKSGVKPKLVRFFSKYPWLLKYTKLICILPGVNKHGLCYIAGNLYNDIVHRTEILGKCYSTLKAAIVPTKFTRKMYIANGLRIPVHEVRFGVDIARESKQIPACRPVRFGFIGQIAYHKGTDILIDAFCRLPQGTAELCIYGSENQVPEYSNMLIAKSVGYSISFCGTFPREKIDEIMQQIDVLVIPSRWYENSPLILLYALASHTPVIVSNVEGLSEFVSEGKNGYLFTLGDADDLERVLHKMLAGSVAALSKTTEYSRDTKTMTLDTIAIYNDILKAQ